MKNFRSKVLGILLALACVLIPTTGAFAATTADVTITATPSFISITNDQATWVMGTIAESSTFWWTSAGTAPAEPLVDGDMKATITNGSSVDITLSVHAHNFTGGVGWALAGAVGANQVKLIIGNTTTANIAAMKVMADTTTQEMTHILAPAATLKWAMGLYTGTFTDGVAKSGTVTVSAVAH